MASPEPTPPDQTLQTALQQRVLRALFGTTALICALALLAAVVLGWRLPGQTSGLMMLGYGSLAVVSAVAMRLPPHLAARAHPAMVIGGMLLVGVVGTLSGWGLQAPGLVFLSLVTCVANAVGSRWFGHTTTALGVAVLLLLGAGERLGWLPTPVGVPPFGARLLMPCISAICGALIGRAVSALVRQYLDAAQAREQRFRALLGIAAAGYWETDDTLRLTQASWRDAHGTFVPVAAVLGRRPWEIEALQFDDSDVDRMRADMERRATLRDLAFRWQPADGGARHYLGNGEPRRDAAGRFLGYWGVARDVTAEHRAREALTSTETRYQELFQNIPSPLTLHQGGRIVDANPAAARLLGYDTVAQMRGLDLVEAHVAEADRALARSRAAAAESAPLGQALPPADLALRTRDGRLVHVKSVGARADHGGLPATLSLSIDETERRAAARALTRSQTLLAQVVAMSPDVITLSDLPTGRYVMINDSFTRLLGYTAADAVGRRSLDLGLWRHAADRERVVRAITEQGLVQDLLVDFVGHQGQIVPLMVSGIRFESEGQSYLLLSSRDVSEATRARLEREAILANASVGIAFTRDRRFIVANAQFERIYGWPEGSLVGQPGRVVWASDSDYEALSREIGPPLARGEAVDIERAAVRQDGSGFLMRLRAKAIDPARPVDSGTIWIAEDVTAARQAEQELARARDAAEAANRAKSAFLANTSHEIRTPLNGLQGLARLARAPGVPPARLRQYLDQIGESADLLSMIISDILDVAKIEAGKLMLESEPFDLPALLRSLQQAYAALAASQGLAFDARIDPDLPTWVRGDALRVRQILTNFLHNALKFTASGGVRLLARPLPGGRVHLEVQDTGPGIDEATQARLFRPFTQADESTTRRFGGTGLGLSICRELATLMGGSVGLSSRVGQGSRFHAELPLPALDAAPPAPGAPADDGPRLRGARVLLVEDNSVNMMIGVALLQQWGMRVTEASDGHKALTAVADAAAAGWRFDVVLMDVQMPDLSGHEVTAALRRRYSARELPIIALTAAALVSERERAAAHGMNDFLTKPIDPPRLHAALLRALRAAAPPAGRVSPA